MGFQKGHCFQNLAKGSIGQVLSKFRKMLHGIVTSQCKMISVYTMACHSMMFLIYMPESAITDTGLQNPTLPAYSSLLCCLVGST